MGCIELGTDFLRDRHQIAIPPCIEHTGPQVSLQVVCSLHFTLTSAQHGLFTDPTCPGRRRREEVPRPRVPAGEEIGFLQSCVLQAVEGGT